jgi:pimeloyl-ACP methyl ester carboxylesterase
MDWIDDVTEKGVRERGFTLTCDDRTVPGVLWSPADEPAQGLVLLGHGAGQHKRGFGMPGQARSLVRHEGFAAVCIDAVGHGDRLPEGGRGEGDLVGSGIDVFAQAGRAAIARLQEQGVESADAVDAMVADWSATIDAILAEVGDVPIGYAGFSMGSFYGTPTVAAEPRIKAAALGLSGLVDGTEGLVDGTEGPMAAIRDRLAAESARVSCPVLFLVQADDEVVPRDAAFRQFDAFGSTHKRMHVNAGLHKQVPRDETPFIELFLASHLVGGSRQAAMKVDRSLPVEAQASPSA